MPNENSVRAMPVLQPTKKTLQLHERASHHDWDDGLESLERILANPACDYGTALLIYWLGSPGFDTQYKTVKAAEPWRRETLSFLRRLEKRLLGHDFKTSLLLFNPRFDRTTITTRGHDWTGENADIKVRRPIPAELWEPSCADPAWERKNKVRAKK